MLMLVITPLHLVWQWVIPIILVTCIESPMKLQIDSKYILVYYGDAREPPPVYVNVVGRPTKADQVFDKKLESVKHCHAHII